MAFLSHLRPNNKSKKPITKRKTSRGIKVTKATPRVATITDSVATAANAPNRALRQLLVILATRTRVNASTNSTAEARNAAMTIAHCICFSPVLCEIRAGLFRRNGPTISRWPPASAQMPDGGIPQRFERDLIRFDHDAVE